MARKISRLRRGAGCLLIGTSLLGSALLGGCATIDNNGLSYYDKRVLDKIMQEAREEVAQKRFKDSYNGFRIISENKDLYIEKVDGSEKRKITNTPELPETWAFITKDRGYIIYRTTDNLFLSDRYFSQSLNKDDSNKVEISEEEYIIHRNERFK